jgi:nucleoside-diphosphate-sugar epimerase
MKVLVTGTTGFVGSCLSRRLLELGYEVHSFKRASSDPWRLVGVRESIVEHVVDLRDNDNVDQAIGMIRPQVVYHCATSGGFADQKDTSAIIETNFLGTVNLLKACEKVGFDYFVNTGSSSEYGIKTHPMDETDALEPIGDYGVSKAAATLFCQSEGRSKQLPIATLRLFSPYGPWDDPKRLIPYVIKSFLRNESPQMISPASVRDFIFINDVLEAYIAVIKKPHLGEIFNIGSGVQHSIGEVVAIVKDSIHSDAEPAWGAIGRQRQEPGLWVSKNSKASKSINWNPSISLKSGLQQTVTWLKSNLNLYP